MGNMAHKSYLTNPLIIWADYSRSGSWRKLWFILFPETVFFTYKYIFINNGTINIQNKYAYAYVYKKFNTWISTAIRRQCLARYHTRLTIITVSYGQTNYYLNLSRLYCQNYNWINKQTAWGVYRFSIMDHTSL